MPEVTESTKPLIKPSADRRATKGGGRTRRYSCARGAHSSGSPAQARDDGVLVEDRVGVPEVPDCAGHAVRRLQHATGGSWKSSWSKDDNWKETPLIRACKQVSMMALHPNHPSCARSEQDKGDSKDLCNLHWLARAVQKPLSWVLVVRLLERAAGLEK